MPVRVGAAIDSGACDVGSGQCQGDSAALRWLGPDHLVSGS
jgi:hypothetical protein